MREFISKWIVLAAFLATSFAAPDVATSTSSYLTKYDRIKLQKVLEPGFNLEDLASTHYAVHGYHLLGESIPNKNEICEFLVKSCGNGLDTSPENIFYIVVTWQILGSCQPLPSAVLKTALTAVIEKETTPIPDLYHAVMAYVGLMQNLPDATTTKIVKMLQAALKKDDNLLNLGYTFHLATVLKSAGNFAFERIEDAIVQADEVDGRYLQFEGGLPVTSLLVTGIARLSASQKKVPPVKPEQIVKLANYLLSRRSVRTSKGVVKLLDALKVLAHNEFSKPVCITLAEDGHAVSAQQPHVTVKVSDILGNPISNVPSVVANSAMRLEDDVVIISKKNFGPSSKDKTLFTMNFMEIKPQRGFYNIVVSAGAALNTVTIKVLTEVKLDFLEIGTGDADQTTQPKLGKVVHPKKMEQKIEADSQQKIVMRFQLQDTSTGKSMRVHQAFVRLSMLAKSGDDKQLREVIFVAEPDSSNVYKFEMPVGNSAQTFGFHSDDYDLHLIIGDAVVSNPFQWHVATVGLKFPQGKLEIAHVKAVGYKHTPHIFSPKPEIKHMFREPEKRPPVFVSNLFTGLCLAPVLLLFILWARLGVNISKFPLSLSAVMFHLGLGGIFVLFAVFWLKLNMFVTLRYLLGLGIVTFLAGSKLLSQIASSQKLSR